MPFLPEEIIEFGKKKIKEIKNQEGPSVLFCPIAFENLRSLTNEHIILIGKYLKEKGFFVYSTHNSDISALQALQIPVLTGYKMLEWLSLIHAADYVISVDTAAFHYAGGIKKPLTGIFTYADGKLRGKYYDFILVQKHRDNGNWPCGPCYNYLMCTHTNCKDPKAIEPRPCLLELTSEEIIHGIEKMLLKWPI